MKRSFRTFAAWFAITGLLMGASYGAGIARGKADTPAESTGLTAQQIQQLIGGASGGSQGNQSQQPQQIFVGPGPGSGPGG
jgi:hypothetical protein